MINCYKFLRLAFSHITVTFLHLQFPFESIKRRIRIDLLEENLMAPEWLYYTIFQGSWKKAKLSHHAIHAFFIFKKEIQDPKMYVILLLIKIYGFWLFLYEENSFSNQSELNGYATITTLKQKTRGLLKWRHLWSILDVWSSFSNFHLPRKS